MRDLQMRAALARKLAGEHPLGGENRIWSEFAVSLGASRVDLCLINGSLSGWEIKSPRDNFARLRGQVDHYGRVLDFAHIVVAERDVVRAHDSVPGWWGVLEAEQGPNNQISLTLRRAAQANEKIDPFSVAQLLWRDEAMQEVHQLRIPGRWAKANRWQLWDALAEHTDLDDLRRIVRSRLKARPLRAADHLYTPGDAT